MEASSASNGSVENRIVGDVSGPTVQAGTIHGDIHLHGGVPGEPAAVQLERLLRQSHDRQCRRLLAAGVPADRVDEVRLLIGSQVVLPNVPAGAVRLLTAPMGHGKTELAHHRHVRDIELAQGDPAAPWPVWLDAHDVTNLVDNFKGAAELNTRGYAIVLDELDGLSPRRATHLLDTAHELVAGWPLCSVLAASRRQPLPGVHTASIPVPPLDPEYGRRVAMAVANMDLPGTTWSSQIRACLTVPLFAIAVGARVATGARVPASTTELLRSLAQHSLSNAHIVLTDQLVNALMTIAVHLADTGAGLEIGTLPLQVTAEVEQTPLVTRRDNTIVFVLPVLEHLFAAQALRHKTVPLDRAASGAAFEYWRYALAIAVKTASAIEADLLMAELVRLNPAAASWVLDETTPFSVRTDSATALRELLGLPDSSNRPLPAPEHPALTAASRLREATSTWREALHPLGDLLEPDDTIWHARLYPNGLEIVETSQQIPQTSLSGGVQLLEVQAGPYSENWVSRTIGPIPDGPTGRWIWSRDRIARSLRPLLDQRGLPADPDGTIAAERIWRLARAVTGTRTSDFAPLQPGSVQEAIATHLAEAARYDDACWSTGRDSYTTGDLRWLAYRIADLKSPVVFPHPQADQPGGGWNHTGYSPAAMLDLVKHVFSSALVSYKDLVDRNFPQMATSLELSSLWPPRLTGVLHLPSHVPRHAGRGPWMHWTTTRAYESPARVLDITLNQSDIDDIRFDEPKATSTSFFDPYRAGTESISRLDVLGDQPVTNYAYKRLTRDLKYFGWQEPMLQASHNN